MIFDAADDDGLAVEAREDAAEVCVQFIAYAAVAKVGATVFGREDGVKQDFCEGLGHGASVVAAPGGFNPFRVDVSRQRTQGRLLRNQPLG
jgi:hypothetical protein